MKTKSSFLFLIFFFNIFLTNPSFADSPWSTNIKVSGSYLVNIEPCITVQYPNIYVSYMAQFQRFTRSTDGGLTWLPETFIPGNPDIDGVINADERGILHLSTVKTQYWRLYYYRSTTQGSTWENPLILNQSNEEADKPWLYNNHNRIYIAYIAYVGLESRLKVVKSTDRGLTFSAGNIANDGNSGTYRLWPILREDPKDSNIVYVSMFWDRRNFGTAFVPPWQMFVAKSTNGGSSWLPNVALPDTGRSPLAPGSMPFQITSSIAVSPVYNDVYAVWNDSLPGGKINIFFSRSTNGAATFEPRVKIPSGPVPDTAYHWQPHIECDIYGTIHLLWYDSRGFPANHSGGKKSTYYTYSTNRGVSWATEEKVSDSTEVFGSQFGTGNYFLFTTDSLRIYSVWSKLRPQGGSDIYFSWRYLPNIIGIPPNNNSIPESFRLEQNNPNPFNPSTKISYEIPVEANINLTIYDASGKEIIVLFKGIQTAGKHEAIWDASEYPSGVYFYKFESDSYIESKKMIVIK